MKIPVQLLDKVGVIPKDYHPQNRLVMPRGIVKSGRAVVKMYQMLMNQKGNTFHPDEIERFANNIASKLNSGEIDQRIGMGYAIASEEILNVVMWGGEFPNLINPNVYGHDRRDLDKPIERKRISEAGAFCVWESAIVEFESNHWREYLKFSEEHVGKEEAIRGAKERYLSAFYQGLVK